MMPLLYITIGSKGKWPNTNDFNRQGYGILPDYYYNYYYYSDGNHYKDEWNYNHPLPSVTNVSQFYHRPSIYTFYRYDRHTCQLLCDRAPTVVQIYFGWVCGTSISELRAKTS